MYYSTIYQQLQRLLKIDEDMNIIITHHGLYLSFLRHYLFSVQKCKPYYLTNREYLNLVLIQYHTYLTNMET